MYGQMPGCQTLSFLHMLGTCLGMPLYHQREPVHYRFTTFQDAHRVRLVDGLDIIFETNILRVSPVKPVYSAPETARYLLSCRMLHLRYNM